MAETRTIRTVLELNAKRFTAGAAQASASAKGVAGELRKITDASGDFRADFDRAGTTLLGFGSAAAAGLGLAAKASMDWESSWAGVLKTVDGSPEQLARVEEGLRGLTEVLPASHGEIAAVAEAAGQLGVETDSVVEFTETMINLGETTNLSAEEAATGLARFSNIMGTSQDDVDRLGAAIVGLGNNFETTEAEILDMSMRLSGIGAQIGLTEGDVLGLATAMSSVGISAEAGGTAMSQGMRKIQDAVDEGGEALAGFAEVAGMSNEEFSKLWSEDSSAGLEAFVQGLARVGEEGGNVAATLDDLGIKGIRESDTFLRLAANAEGLSDALEVGNAEFERNMALTDEALKRYETTESQLRIAQNALIDAGIDIGASVLPVLADTAGAVADLAGWFGKLPGPVQSSVTGLGAAAGATALLAGGLMRAVPAAMDTVEAFKRLRQQSPRTATALGKVGRAAGVAARAFVALQIGGAVADTFREATNSAEAMAAEFLNASETGQITKASLDEMFAATGTGNAEVRDLAHALEILDANAIEKAGDFLASGLGVWDTQTEVAKQRVEELDQALGAMYTSGNVEAVAEALEASGVPIETLIENLPTLETALKNTATQMGLEADAATLAKIATGELVPVVDEATGEVDGYATAQEAAADATADGTGEVEEQVDALAELQDMLQGTADLLLGVRGSERDFLDAIDAGTEALKEHGKVFEENGEFIDRTSQSARDAQADLDGIAESTHRWADAAEEAGASGEELDAIMKEGRDAFVELAEDMGMSEEAANRLADELNLLPEFVETEVKVETEKAQAEWDEFIEQGGHAPLVPVGADTEPAEGDVLLFQDGLVSDDPTLAPVGADTAPAEGDVDEFKDETEGTTADVGVSANIEPAEWQVDMLVAAVEAREGSVTVNGETVNAETALDQIMVEINESDGTVTVNGRTVPAEEALLHAIEAINSSGGTVTIEGNNKPAKDETNEAKRHADNTEGTIDVDADTSAANAAINAAARTRTAYVNVIATGATSALRAGLAGLAHGGWMNEGLAGGGWVPGRYPGAGVDNVLWPVRDGRAPGGYLDQPLAGTEFVMNGRSAQQWGPALEAMNAGLSPERLAALVNRGGGSSRSVEINATGLNAYQVALEARNVMRHEIRSEAVPLP